MTSKTKARYSVGVDPGWRHLGLAIIKHDGKGLSLLYSAALDPAALGGHVKATNHIVAIVNNRLRNDGADPDDLFNVTIERYVAYGGVNTAEAENILMLIGALVYAFSASLYGNASLSLYRAIEWKTNLVKLLVKNRGFDNPSSSLDKKFSIAAAHACLDIPGEFKTDHEADAIDLACIDLLKNRYTTKRKVS